MTCVGNHEHYYNFSGYVHRFNMPGIYGYHSYQNNLWYSWIYGGIYFLAYSTEHSFDIDSEQYNFIINDLNTIKNNKNIKWKILYGHRPIYCSTNDYYDCQENGPNNIKPIIEPLLNEFQFDFYFAGHLHNFERMYVVNNGTVISKDYNAFNNSIGTVNMVIGMSGDDEGLTETWETNIPDWSAKRIAKLGYLKFKVFNDTTANLKFVESGTQDILDEITVNRLV